MPLPKVRPMAEDEMFRVLTSGKRKKKQWKRMITKATFVGAGFTRKPPKYAVSYTHLTLPTILLV